MAHESTAGDVSRTLPLAELKPYLSIVVLRCAGIDPAKDFADLVRFLRNSASESGRALATRIRSQVVVAREQEIDGLGALAALGLDELFGLAREIHRTPSWAGPDAGLVDVANELMIAARRENLVAVCSRTPSEARFRKWINRDRAPFRFIPPPVLSGAFQGDGRMVWMQGVHRRRSNKPDTQALGGLRLQDAMNVLTHGSYALRAAKVDFQPEDDIQVLRDLLTVSPQRSRISWKRPSYFGLFLAATVEALDVLDKALANAEELLPLFGDLASYETNLDRVRGAFDIMVADPDLLRADPDVDDEDAEHAEALLGALLEVRGDPASAVVEVDVGYNDATAGTLVLRPVAGPGGFDLTVGIRGVPLNEPELRQIKDMIDESDVLSIYYETGHVLNQGQVVHQAFTNKPFRNIEFEDFSGFDIVHEKPRMKPGKSLHEVIGDSHDDSLFGWVVARYREGWLLCDDGAGEIADFLHLANDGTLTVIHVKAATSLLPDRKIAVTRFEQVVSQAEKNSRFLVDGEALAAHLSGSRIAGLAAWHDGARIPADQFANQLSGRTREDKTFVVVVQPHLLRSVHDRARAAIRNGQPTLDSRRLMLLDDLLNSTKQTIDARCDGLTVICCA